MDSLKAVIISIILLLLAHQVDMLPWWGFIIPLFIFGVLINYLKWNVAGFSVGFIAGFLLWAGANVYYDIQYDGLILQKVALLFSLPKIVVFLIAGIIGGLLAGLAMYSGKGLFSYRAASPVLED
ncbi:hypothetical protein [Hymenobacter lucidus]|nr:hypothetical protein [Hymenobacter lucidus]